MVDTIITSGVDSEYVLGSLCRYLRNSGFNVIEVNFSPDQPNPIEILKKLQELKTVYITSSHINLTRINALFIAPKLLSLYPYYLSPLEIISYLRPLKSIYIPHDLLSPFGDSNLNELRYVGLFDYVLTTEYPDILSAAVGNRAEVIDAGWIKYDTETMSFKKNLKSTASDLKIVLFISWIEGLRQIFGDIGVVDYIAPLIKEGIKVKFPAWHGVDRIEACFRERYPNNLVKSSESSTELIISSDIVVCNFASSIHAEANFIGKPAICLLDDLGISSEEQKEKLRHLPQILYHDYHSRQPISDEFYLKAYTQSTLKQGRVFDFEIVKNILLNIKTL